MSPGITKCIEMWDDLSLALRHCRGPSPLTNPFEVMCGLKDELVAKLKCSLSKLLVMQTAAWDANPKHVESQISDIVMLVIHGNTILCKQTSS